MSDMQVKVCPSSNNCCLFGEGRIFFDRYMNMAGAV